jgi:hypothetical protein
LQFLAEFGQPIAAMRLDQTPGKVLLKLSGPALYGGLVQPQRFGGCRHAAGAGESKRVSKFIPGKPHLATLPARSAPGLFFRDQLEKLLCSM